MFRYLRKIHRLVPLPFRSIHASVRTLFPKSQKHLAPCGSRYMAWRSPWPATDFKLGIKGSMRVTCKFGFGDSTRLTSRGANKFLQAFTRRHVPCAMCHQLTHDRYHGRSGVSVRRMMPVSIDQPFGRYSRICLNTHRY